MKNRNYFAIILLLFLLPFESISRQSVSDSLLLLLQKSSPSGKNSGADTVRVNQLLALVAEIRDENPDTAMLLSFEALHLAEKITLADGVKGWHPGTGQSYHHIATLYGMKGDYSNSLEYFSRAIDVWERMERETKNSIALTQKSKSLGNVGMVYWHMKDYETALRYDSLSLSIDEKTGNRRGMARNLGNIGNVYKSMGNYEMALDFELKALKIQEEIKYNYGVATTLGNIGAIYSAMKKNKEAEKYLLRALPMSKAEGDLYGVMEVTNQLSELYVQSGKYKEGLAYYKHYSSIKDSLFNAEKDKEILRKTMSYEFEKKQTALRTEQEKKEAVHLAESQKQKIIRNASLGGLGGVLLLAIVLLYGFIQKRKANAVLERTLIDLRNTQDQLVRSEKMAAFGVMAARVAHEIENPLNFVNNFSELSDELLDEYSISASEEDKQQAMAMLKENLQHINHHGKRADGIVKQLLAHTRSGTAYEFFEEK